MQLATYAGWLLHGVRGGLMAGLLFVLPGAAVIIALSALYVLAADVPIVDGFLFGLKAAVLAVVIEALLRVSKRALKGRRDYLVAVLAFIAIAAFHVPFPVIILAAGLAGAWFGTAAQSKTAPVDDRAMPDWTKPTLRRFVTSLTVWGALWLVPLAALYLTLGPQNIFTQQASFFSVMATVTFGGAYAVLAWVAQQAVQVYGWLSPDDMLTGLGLPRRRPVR
jgi:chromate transporter